MNPNNVDAFLEYVNGEIEKMDWANAKPMKPAWERKPAPMWDLASGVAFCRQLEESLNGKWHVSLGGSVLYRGYSDKDLDVVIRSHGQEGRQGLISEVMAGMGWVWLPGEMYSKQDGNEHMTIEIWHDNNSHTDKRVDLFIVKAKEPLPVIDVPGVIPF